MEGEGSIYVAPIANIASYDFGVQHVTRQYNEILTYLTPGLKFIVLEFPGEICKIAIRPKCNLDNSTTKSLTAKRVKYFSDNLTVTCAYRTCG